jgi:3-hydroxybutyrate dehydrogenase
MARLSEMKGKSALVTGSTGGLGFAIAQALAEAGCRVVRHGIEASNAADYHRADLRDPGAIETMMRAVGPVDILVNNAVVRHFAPLDQFPAAKWDEAIAVNLSAAFHTIRLALPGMRERRWGRIFNMSSVYGSRAVANRIDYVTTKTALLGMTRAVALETAKDGITCNAVCPGTTLTPGNDARIRAMMSEQGIGREEAERRFLAGKQPTGEFTSERHVAELVVFLCGAAGDSITGAMLPMEGGWLAG